MTRARRTGATLALAAWAWAAGAVPEAKTRIVSNVPGRGCGERGRGSPEKPLCSLQKAVDRAGAGDVVEVHGGVYGPAELTIPLGGGSRRPLVVRSVPPRAAAIVGPPGAGEAAGSAVRIVGSYVVFEGFEVRDAAGTGIRIVGHHVTVRDCYVHHNAARCDPTKVGKCGQGIASNNAPRNAGLVIERNLAAHNGSGGRAEDHNFYLSGPGIVVRNNVSVGADDFGFQIYPDCDGCLIQNNVAIRSGRSGFLFGGDRSAGRESGDLMIANNISAWNRQSGYAFYQPGGASALMSRNLAFGNGEGPTRFPEEYRGLTIRDLIEADPMLVDPDGLDFHLRPGSPAIDAGDPDFTPPDDIDGDARPSGAGVDVGADEFVRNRDRQP